MKKRFSEEQIVGFLREAEAGLALKDLCWRDGFSEAGYYLWRAKFGGMSAPDAKTLKHLETENARLKKLLAGMLLDAEVTITPDTAIPGAYVARVLERSAQEGSGRGAAGRLRSGPEFAREPRRKGFEYSLQRRILNQTATKPRGTSSRLLHIIKISVLPK